MTFVRPPSTQESVLLELRDRIGSGRLRPGEKVQPEILSAELGVSRIPIREALKILEGEGQVTYRPHRGFFVAALSMADLRELYRMRELLESEAIQSAIPRVDEHMLEHLSRHLDAAEAAGRGNDLRAYAAANRRFHLELFEQSGRPLLVRTIRQLWDASDAYRAMYANSAEHRAAAALDHRSILRALSQRDAAAAIAAHDDHRNRALVALAELLEEDSDA